MIFWNTKKIAEQIADDALTSEEKFKYLMGSNVLYSIAAYFVWYFAASPSLEAYWAEALFILFITIYGTLRCCRSFSAASASGKSLIEAFFILGFPLGIKIFLFIGVATTVFTFAVGQLASYAARADLITPSNVEGITCVLNGSREYSSVFISIVTSGWLYLRMSCHLSAIANRVTSNE